MKVKNDSQWISRRSELSGFDKAYYLTDARGDYIRVDVNTAAGRAMLIVEDRTEKRYSAFIENGVIQWEKAGDRPSSAVEQKMRSKSRIFSQSPYPAIVLIKGFYGIKSPGAARNRKKVNRGYRGVLISLVALIVICAVVLYLSFR